MGPKTQSALKKYRQEVPETKRDSVSFWDVITFSPVMWFLRRVAQPAVSAGQDVVHKNVTVPVQKALGITPKSPIKDQDDFSNPFLNTLDSINVSQLDKQVPDWRERTSRGDTVRIAVKGSDYSKNYGGTRGKSLKSRLTNPIDQIETTLGSYNVAATKDNIITTDITDWSKTNLDNESIYGFIRNRMPFIGTSEDAPSNEKIKTRIVSKRR